MTRAVQFLRWSFVAIAGPALAAYVVAAAAAPAAPERVADGERLYGMYCAACHGTKARGDGPTATVLKTRPTDLTRLAGSRRGEFPADRVRAAIDGRGLEHGTPEMPLWGLAFQDWGCDVNQEDEVRARIDALVAWLETIQR